MMTLIKNLLSILFFTVIIVLSGCSDAINVSPTSSVTSEGFWESPGDAETYLEGVYDRLRNLSNTTLYGEDRGDTFKPGNIGPVSEAWAQNLTAANTPSWTSFYNLIYHTNRLLTEIEQIKYNDSRQKNKIKAQAHAIRALIYFKLAKIWGEVPVVTQPANDLDTINSTLQARAPLIDVFEQINEDISKALELFPSEDFFDKNKITKPATYALLADVKVWTAKVLNGGKEDLTDALDAIEEVESSGITLLDEFRDVFDPNNEKNNEIILSLFFEKEEQTGMYGDRLATWGSYIQDAENKDEIAYTQRNSARSVYSPSEKLVNSFNKNDDIRREAAIVAAVTSTQDTILTVFNKYRGTEYSDDRYFDNDLIVYRYADIILLKAEALAALDRLDKAIIELNRTRNRAGLEDYSGSMDQNSIEREILKERWRELFAELKRWNDLVRFHEGGTINIYKQVPNLSDQQGYPLYFPVSQDVLDNNNDIKQTEGYLS